MVLDPCSLLQGSSMPLGYDKDVFEEGGVRVNTRIISV
jgi:hypothetical protein